MSADEVVQRVGGFAGRRRFLSRAAAAAMSTAVAVLGLPQRAEAVPWRCCDLCFSPSPTCCRGRPVVCTWSWTCCHTNGRRYRCIECYCGGGDCNADCSGVSASRVIDLGVC